MVLSKKLINDGYILEQEDKALLVLSFLHINEVINYASLKANINNLAQGKLLRRVNTYKSPINKKWYNDENFLDILIDILNDNTKKDTISINEFADHVKLYLGFQELHQKYMLAKRNRKVNLKTFVLTTFIFNTSNRI